MKKTLVIPVIVIMIAALAAGCSQKKVAEVSNQASTDNQSATDASQRQQGGQPGITPSESVTERPVGTGQPAARTGSVQELQSKLKDIHFDFDRYDITEQARPILKELAADLARNKDIKVIIEGHCDDRGTNEYNLALGERRAKAAKDYLISLGIPSSRSETVSYGAEKPLCSEKTEDCWAKNRRDHFVLIREGR